MKFKPSDFSFPNHFGDGVDALSHACADRANARLAEMLAEAPLIFGHEHDYGSTWVSNEKVIVGRYDLTARLVDIREVEK